MSTLSQLKTLFQMFCEIKFYSFVISKRIREADDISQNDLEAWMG